MPYFEKKFKQLSNLQYITSCFGTAPADLHLDIASTGLPNDQFDCIICCHILEHIPDDRKAMKELFRILKPGGWAVIQSPMDVLRDHTFEDPSVISPEERTRLFGQKDHLRMYGKDLKKRLMDAGFIVEGVDYASRLGEAAIKRNGLLSGKWIFLCKK